jgi:hypothetical protein
VETRRRKVAKASSLCFRSRHRALFSKFRIEARVISVAFPTRKPALRAEVVSLSSRSTGGTSFRLLAESLCQQHQIGAVFKAS